MAGLIIDAIILGAALLDYAINGIHPSSQEGGGLIFAIASFPTSLVLWIENPVGPIVNCVLFGTAIGAIVAVTKGFGRWVRKSQAANGA